ncbi:hypothetical protein PV04_05997 [Phialophora macrospora]|uniref:Uncharacterized protein n=1 Tax=Phialophora macrospora TaxID=1851006 RepID=A0A0D2G3P8_9EURO|nr:hypothetical protein PV04_05997 [Phialophora macrospora]
MRNAIAAVLSARSALPQDTTTSSGPAPSPPTESTTPSLPAATTLINVAISTTTGPGGSPITISAPTPVTYTPIVVVLTEPEPSHVTTSVNVTVAGTNPSAASTTVVEFTYIPSYSVEVTTGSGQTSLTSTSSTVSPESSSIATTGSPPTPDPNSQANHQSDGDLSGGAVAGVAIGCAIAGALIAFGLLFFLMGDRLKKRPYSGGAPSHGNSRHSSSRKPGYLNSTLRQSGDRAKGGAVERSVEEVTAENVLEQPKDDPTIKQSVASLFKAIEDHADNYYLDTPATSEQTKEPAGQSSHLPSGITAQNDVDFGALLADRHSRSSAITALITAQILDAIDFFGMTEKSLLPEMVTTFLRSSAGQLKDDQRSRLSLSRWRTSTAALLGPADSPERRAHSQMVIDGLIADADSIVGTYLRPETNNERHQHLVKLCRRGQELGLLLLSQPTEWNFHWTDAANARRSAFQAQRGGKGKKAVFVVQPQLRRVTDNVGRKLDRPLIVLDWQLLQ